MDDTPTVATLLVVATEQLRAVSPTARLDAELLLSHALGWSRVQVLAERNVLVPAPTRRVFETLIARRLDLEPVAYLTGKREFFGLEFLVDRRVLVPRPDTELLVELALAAITPLTSVAPDTHLTLADIGTGSGCVAIALAHHVPRVLVYATDCSLDALDVAAQNIARHQVEGRVRLLRGQLTDPIPELVDILISNPPYTILAEIDEGVRRHEPRAALDGGPDGLNLYRRLLPEAARVVRPQGVILLEIGETQGAAVVELARQIFPMAQISVHQDLAGLDRVVQIKRV